MKPRACLSCYQRKIKCDRKQPCTNCVNLEEPCSFPAGKIRRNRPARKAVEAPLVEELLTASEMRRVEGDIPISSLYTAEEHEYMVADGASQTRLLAGNAWANVKEEVRQFTNHRRLLF